MTVIALDRLKKNYGAHQGTRDVTFAVERGEIFGFVGPNGAGKSTTLKVLMGFIHPTSGKASIRGHDTMKEAKEIKRFTGYVPSDVRLYPHMKVEELLRRNAGFYRRESLAEATRLCALFEVDGGKRFRELSTGNRKKVSIVCALMANPGVIILDEPTNGLDPVMQSKLFHELTARTRDGATVLLSSHNLAEVQAYCDRVAFIKDGSILAVVTPREEAAKKIITVIGGGERTPDGFEAIDGAGAQRRFRTAMDGRAILAALGALAPDDFTVENESMEQYFWHLFGQEGRP